MEDSNYFMGLKFNPLTRVELLEEIDRTLSSEERAVIGYLNPEVVMKARREPGYRANLNSATINIVDGTGIALGIRLLSSQKVVRVQGTDVIWDIAERGAVRGWRIFLFGGSPGVATAAAKNLRGRHPSIHVVGTEHGFLGAEEHPRLVKQINRMAPDILFVCLGMGLQESWAQRWRSSLDTPVLFCNGGALDFVAGVYPRAPRFLRRMGLEWAYRLVQDPRRWRRQRHLPGYVFAVFVRYITGRRGE